MYPNHAETQGLKLAILSLLSMAITTTQESARRGGNKLTLRLKASRLIGLWHVELELRAELLVGAKERSISAPSKVLAIRSALFVLFFKKETGWYWWARNDSR